jgi:hypothetical protein
VATEDEAAVEREEQVLPASLDSRQTPPVEPLGETEDGGARVRSLDLDALADERLQAASGAMESIAFWHVERIGA